MCYPRGIHRVLLTQTRLQLQQPYLYFHFCRHRSFRGYFCGPTGRQLLVKRSGSVELVSERLYTLLLTAKTVGEHGVEIVKKNNHNETGRAYAWSPGTRLVRSDARLPEPSAANESGPQLRQMKPDQPLSATILFFPSVMFRAQASRRKVWSLLSSNITICSNTQHPRECKSII